jgi:hypothetical protein
VPTGVLVRIQSWAQGKVLPKRKDFFYGIPRSEGCFKEGAFIKKEKRCKRLTFEFVPSFTERTSFTYFKLHFSNKLQITFSTLIFVRIFSVLLTA